MEKLSDDKTKAADIGRLLELLAEGNLTSVINQTSGCSHEEPDLEKIRNVAKELSQFLEVLNALVEGDYSPRIPYFNKKNEIGITIARIAESVTNTANTAAEVKEALEKERSKFIEEDWLKTHYTTIFSKIQGVKSISELGNTVLNDIAASTGAQLGAFFVKILDESVTTDLPSINLKLIASYGINLTANKQNFIIGEGIIGQCAVDKQPRYLDQIPDGFSKIESGLGSMKPSSAIIMPIIYEGELYGILEIASINQFTEMQKRLLEQISNNIGISIKNISGNMLTEKLLSEIAKKNSSLASQKQALDSSAIVAETDPAGKITYVNDKFLEISKFDRSELMGQDHRILNSKHHPKEFFVHLWKTISKGEVWHAEVKNKTKTGLYYWVDTTIYPVKDENGKISKYVAIRFDITDRKLAEEKLNTANSSIISQKKALDSSAIVAETNPTGKITYVNDKFLEISKYARNELMGQDHRILNSKHHPKEFFINLWKTISKGEVWHAEVKNRTKTGTYYWVDTTIYPVKDEHDKISKYVAIRFDITDRKLAEEKLNTANSSIINQKQALDSSAIVAETDPAGRITYVNDKFLEISKYDRDELMGQDHRILNSRHHSKEFFINLWKTISHGDVWHAEVKNKTKTGSYYWVDTTIYPVKDENGKIQKYVAIRFDITDKKRALEDLLLATERTKSADKAKTEFLSSMSHEIRTPLNGIIGMVDLLADSTLTEDQRELCSAIAGSGQTLLSIVNDILDFSKIEAGKVNLENTEFNAGEYIKDICKQFEVMANKKGLSFSYNHSPLLFNLYGDAGRLGQVIMNIVGNALKFTKKGNVNVKVELTKESQKNATILISVQDTGIGIPEEAKSHMFQAFTQAEQSTTRRFGGTGLGLSISKRLTELMGGRIWYESTYGTGTTFFLEIPFEKRIQLASKYLSKGSLHPSFKDIQLTGRILVAEDNHANQKVIASMLTKIGCTHLLVANGDEVLDALKNHTFDLILMDCQMPDKDGYETTQMIRKDERNPQRDIPIVALTANVLEGVKLRCVEAGMNDYLSKPIDKTRLASVLGKYLKGP